jgi:hypothetical protein
MKPEKYCCGSNRKRWSLAVPCAETHGMLHLVHIYTNAFGLRSWYQTAREPPRPKKQRGLMSGGEIEGAGGCACPSAYNLCATITEVGETVVAVSTRSSPAAESAL